MNKPSSLQNPKASTLNIEVSELTEEEESDRLHWERKVESKYKSQNRVAPFSIRHSSCTNCHYLRPFTDTVTSTNVVIMT